MITQIDYTVLNWIQKHLSFEIMDKIMIIVTRLGDGILWIIPCILCLFFKKTRRVGISMAVALILSVFLGEWVIKPIVGRIRPFYSVNFVLLIPAPSSYSFPSMHSMTSFSAATAIFCGSKKLGVIALVSALLVAFSRLYLYVHFPTDVLIGSLIGIYFGLLSYKLSSPILNRLTKIHSQLISKKKGSN